MSFLVEGTLPRMGILRFYLPALALIYSPLALFLWPRYLRNLKVTLTDTHLRIERRTLRRKIVHVPRSSIFKVELKHEMVLPLLYQESVYVYTRDRQVPWYIRLTRGRIRLFCLDRPDHLRKQLLEPDGSDNVVSLDESSVVPLEQENPTWTRHS